MPEPSPASAAGPGRRDWASQVADTIEHVVGLVRTNTVDRVEKLARLLVYGLVAAILGLVAAVLMTILVVRVLDVFLPVWLAYVLVGGLFTLAGAFAWSKRSPEP